MTADPRIVPQARKLAKVHFDEMLEMAGAGSKVLALRSVEFARNHDVPLHVRSAFTWEPGTWVTNEEASMEDPIISGVVTDMTEAKVTVLGVPDQPGVSAALFEPLANANVNVDMIVQNTSTDGTTDISFTMPMADMAQSETIVQRIAEEIEGGLEDADVGLDAGDNDLLATAVLDRLAKAVVAGAGEGELAGRGVAEDSGEAVDGRSEALRVLLAADHRNIETPPGIQRGPGGHVRIADLDDVRA